MICRHPSLAVVVVGKGWLGGGEGGRKKMGMGEGEVILMLHNHRQNDSALRQTAGDWLMGLGEQRQKPVSLNH